MVETVTAVAPVVDKKLDVVKPMNSGVVQRVGVEIVNPDQPLRMEQKTVFSNKPGEAVKRTEALERGKPKDWPDPEESPAEAAVKEWNLQKKAEFDAKGYERRIRKTLLETEKNTVDLDDHDRIQDIDEEIAALESATSETALDGLDDKQLDEYEQRQISREKIDQNLRYQEARLAKGMEEFKKIMSDPEADLVAKAAKLRELQQLYTAVDELRSVVQQLDETQVVMLEKSGMMTEDEIKQLRYTNTQTAKQAENKRDAYLIKSDNENLLSGKTMLELSVVERNKRSVATTKMAEGLIAQLEGVRSKSLTEEEKKSYMEAWGLTTTKIEGVDYQIARKGSVLETVLIVEGRKQDAQVAYDANMEAVGKDQPCQEKAFEAANLLVQAQAAEVITHAMILETVNHQDTNKAIEAAKILGAWDKVNNLRLLLQRGKEFKKTLQEVVGPRAKPILDVIKEGGKKVSKVLLYGMAAVLIAALLTASGMISALGGGRS